jgi:Ni/Co efflux regulator RcnB
MNKSTLLTAVAALALAGPFAISSASAQQSLQRNDQLVQHAQYQGPTEYAQNQDARREVRNARDDDRSDHRDRRESWRDDRQDARWDDARHNGYYNNSQWTYGPPPEGRYGRGDVVYGYQPWQRGQRLGYYNNRYSEVDYRSHRGLRAPPRGQHWVRNDGGDFLLVAIATGLIAQVILNSSR